MKVETMKKETMMVGEDQEALHQVEEEIGTDMKGEITAPAMRIEGKEEEAEGVEVIAQLIEAAGDTIA